MDRQEFEAWVRHTFWPWQVVGTAYHLNKCPLAQYLRAKYNIHESVSVSSERYTMDGASFKTPNWAKTFIQLVDYSHGCYAPIRRKRVLNALRQIPEGT